MISLQGLHKYFNKGKQNEIHVIDDVTLEFPEHGMCAIFGPSGCGKTTLLNVIGGLDKYAEGEVKYDESVLAGNTDTLRNQYTGFIFQNYNLNKDDSVYENVAATLRLCGLEDEETIRERVHAALSNVGMDKFAKRTPDTLSGGQQQRVAIARALVKNPRVILADEPTGNLDEANTILIMDILKKLSKEHLVLLVTHEANLVDYYCDMVIELSDGRVVNVRKNASAEGYVARDKNTVFLGEYEEHDIEGPCVEARFFGDVPEKPVRLTIINRNGRLLLRVDTEKVQIVDSYSEVSIREGVYEQEARHEERSREIDMSKLPPIEGTRYGRLFRFRSSVRSGYRSSYKAGKTKRSGKMLRACMVLFGVIIVVMTAFYGTGLKQLVELDEEYHNKMFYVSSEDGRLYERLKDAKADPESGIVSIWPETTNLYNRTGYDTLIFYAYGFESYKPADNDDYGGYYEPTVKASILAREDIPSDARVLAGSIAGLTNQDIVVTKKVADKIIESEIYTYLKEYNNLLGMTITINSFNAPYPIPFRVAAILDSDDAEGYLAEQMMAYGSLASEGLGTTVLIDEHGDFGVKKGECTFVRTKYNERDEYNNYKEYLSLGDVITVNGVEVTVSDWIDYAEPKEETDKEMMPEGTEGTEGGEEIETETEEEIERKLLENETREKLNRIRGYIERFVPKFVVILHPEDYIAAGRVFGPTTNYLFSSRSSSRYYESAMVNPLETIIPKMNAVTAYRILSRDVETTEKYLTKQVGDLPRRLTDSDDEMDMYMEPGGVIYDYREVGTLMTPAAFYKANKAYNEAQISRALIIMGVVFIVLCICMFFIMKASTINRIQEIGIYRAIGTTRKNILFKFAVESGVVATLSVFVGYLVASLAMFYIQSMGGFVQDIIYYTWWMALIVLIVIFVVCILCGIIPVFMLLRRTPSEILAKYDI